MPRLLIYAPNIYSGGGKVLLESVLKNLTLEKVDIISNEKATFLKNHSSSIANNFSFQSNIWGRLKAELALRSISQKYDKILCFGNLPPILKTHKKADLFFQNSLIIESNLNYISRRYRFKFLALRMIIHLGLRNIDKVYIQSDSLVDKFNLIFPKKTVVLTPFCDFETNIQSWSATPTDFVYVASGDSHKNHERLLDAWQILANQNTFPSLTLTVPKRYIDLNNLIQEKQQNGLKIYNYSEDLTHAQVLYLYTNCNALIYPSLTESFGLPLIEAQKMKLPIVAAELDYVRDFVNPNESFNPLSAKSIARAVIRFQQKQNNTTQENQKVIATKKFIEIIMQP